MGHRIAGSVVIGNMKNLFNFEAEAPEAYSQADESMGDRFAFESERHDLDSASKDLGRRGYWIRQGSKIILLPMTKLVSEDGEVYELSGGGIPSPTRRVLTYSTKDVIDERISVPAQHSLVRLSKNPATRTDAVALLAEVKAGRLGGIFCANWQKPAQRAIRLRKSWWTVIPSGDDAVLMPDPNDFANGRPLIAFRRELDPDCGLLKNEKRFAAARGRLDAALLRAWSSYKLWRSKRLLRCNQRVAALQVGVRTGTRFAPPVLRPVSNIVPAIFCQLGDAPATLCAERLPENCIGSTDRERIFVCKHEDRARRITFEFCWTTLSFNPRARGEVDFDAGTQKLTFACLGAEAADPKCGLGRVLCVPAWEYEATVIARGPGLPNAADWEFGFLQTVRSSLWVGLYSGGTASMCEMRDTRDELAAGNPPWVMPSAVAELCGATNATFTDSPFARFKCTHPVRKSETLRQVCFKGTFDIWLAAKRKKDKPVLSNFVLLGFKQIEVDRMWQRDSDSDPCSDLSWKHFGGQQESLQRCGPSLPSPVLSGQPANVKSINCFKDTKGIACATPNDVNKPRIGGDCVPAPACRV
jgi:hypothetical protein